MSRTNPPTPGRWPIPVDADVARAVSRLNMSQREFYEERCGILIFDAHIPVAQAEREALELTRQYFGLIS